METIKIEIPFNKQEFIKANELRMKLVLAPFRMQVTGMAIGASTALLISFFIFLSEKKIHFFFYITILFVVITLMSLQSYIHSKKKNRLRIDEVADKYERQQQDCSYELSEDSVKYSDQDKAMALKWQVFDGYLLHQDYLILSMQNSFLTAYFFSRKQIDSESFDQLLAIAQQKLPQKKLR